MTGTLQYRCRRCGGSLHVRTREDVAETVENPPPHLLTARHACADRLYHGLADLVGGKEDE